MQVLVLFLLVAGSFVAGSPTCSDEEVNKCGAGRTVTDPFPSTPEALDALCPDAISELNCQIDFANRCPKTITGAFKVTLTEYRALFKNLCSDTNLRKIYLRHALCVNKVADESAKTCEHKYDDYCKQVWYAFACGRENVVKTCGSSEAGEVFDALMRPAKESMKVFGC